VLATNNASAVTTVLRTWPQRRLSKWVELGQPIEHTPIFATAAREFTRVVPAGRQSLKSTAQQLWLLLAIRPDASSTVTPELAYTIPAHSEDEAKALLNAVPMIALTRRAVAAVSSVINPDPVDFVFNKPINGGLGLHGTWAQLDVGHFTEPAAE
jgi:hypothetical protein